MPDQVSEPVGSVTVGECAFCKDAVIERQLVLQYPYQNPDVYVIYSIRKGAEPGSRFLILPKRHTAMVYGLNSSEIHHIWVVRKALAKVIKETHPGCEVIDFTQDDPAVGQSVPHSHEQVVAVDPKTVALTWTMMSLFYPTENVSDEEMQRVRKKFGEILRLEIDGITEGRSEVTA